MIWIFLEYDEIMRDYAHRKRRQNRLMLLNKMNRGFMFVLAIRLYHRLCERGKRRHGFVHFWTTLRLWKMHCSIIASNFFSIKWFVFLGQRWLKNEKSDFNFILKNRSLLEFIFHLMYIFVTNSSQDLMHEIERSTSGSICNYQTLIFIIFRNCIL